MTATEIKGNFCCGKDTTIPVLMPGNRISDEQSRNLPKNTREIYLGLCTDCRFLGNCVWQHNNKLTCEHFK